MLQHDRQLKLIAGRLEKKIAGELKSMLENDREKYEEFWKSFGLQIKYGMYEGYGAKKDELKDLVLFTSSNEKKLTSLKEYFERMKPEQSCIYYGCGESAGRILSLPQAEALMEKGFELLCLTDDVDEFALKMLEKYEDKEFRNITAEGLDLQSDEEKQHTKELADENKELLERMAKALEGKVQEVKLNSGLMSHPAALSTQGAISAEMEKVLNNMPAGEKVKAQRVLELNPEHPVFAKLRELDEERLSLYAKVLYGQALLVEGTPLEDPAEFARQVSAIIA